MNLDGPFVSHTQGYWENIYAEIAAEIVTRPFSPVNCYDSGIGEEESFGIA